MQSNLPRTIAERFGVSLRWSQQVLEGHTRHLSARGMSVTTDTHIPVGQVVAAWIKETDLASFPSDGTVQWVRKLPFWSQASARWELGIRFLAWSEVYFRFLETFIRDYVERRKFQRYEDELKVVVGVDRDDTEELTRNISRGGLLVDTNKELQDGDEVLVGLTIPDLLDQLQLWCEVLRSRPTATDGVFTVSMRIVAFDHDDGETYNRYIDYLRSLYSFESIPVRPPTYG